MGMMSVHQTDQTKTTRKMLTFNLLEILVVAFLP